MVASGNEHTSVLIAAFGTLVSDLSFVVDVMKNRFGHGIESNRAQRMEEWTNYLAKPMA